MIGVENVKNVISIKRITTTTIPTRKRNAMIKKMNPTLT
jgi:hypothetical protein